MKKIKNCSKSILESGSLHRFVVSSAQEAVVQIREKLGTSAEVVSVQQVKGRGLERFLSSPKLEVVAQVKPASKVTGATDADTPLADTVVKDVAPSPSPLSEDSSVKIFLLRKLSLVASLPALKSQRSRQEMKARRQLGCDAVLCWSGFASNPIPRTLPAVNF